MATSARSERKLSVLYITPNYADYVLLSRAVADLEVILIHQETGVAAREHLTFCDDSELPNLIILAGRLPMLTAGELVTELKGDERTRSTPILVLSSFVNSSDVRSLYAAGANCVFTLPGDLNQCEEMLSAVRDLWLRYAELPCNDPG